MGFAWSVEFYDGVMDQQTRSSRSLVRLVAGERKMSKTFVLMLIAGMFSTSAWTAQVCVHNLASESTPSSDFTDNEDGTATHNTTGLMWRQCPFKTDVEDGECAVAV